MGLARWFHLLCIALHVPLPWLLIIFDPNFLIRVNMVSLRPVVKGLLVLLQGSMRDGYSAAQLEAKCISLGLASQAIASLSASWGHRTANIAASIVSKTLTTNRLVDMDWNFGVTAASNDSDQVGKTFLQLKMTIDVGEGSSKDIFIELSLDQFYSFLGHMERCKAYLDFVSA
jgi:COMM domain containing 7